MLTLSTQKHLKEGDSLHDTEPSIENWGSKNILLPSSLVNVKLVVFWVRHFRPVIRSLSPGQVHFSDDVVLGTGNTQQSQSNEKNASNPFHLEMAQKMFIGFSELQKAMGHNGISMGVLDDHVINAWKQMLN